MFPLDPSVNPAQVSHRESGFIDVAKDEGLRENDPTHKCHNMDVGDFGWQKYVCMLRNSGQWGSSPKTASRKRGPLPTPCLYIHPACRRVLTTSPVPETVREPRGSWNTQYQEKYKES